MVILLQEQFVFSFLWNNLDTGYLNHGQVHRHDSWFVCTGNVRTTGQRLSASPLPPSIKFQLMDDFGFSEYLNGERKDPNKIQNLLKMRVGFCSVLFVLVFPLFLFVCLYLFVCCFDSFGFAPAGLSLHYFFSKDHGSRICFDSPVGIWRRNMHCGLW